MWPVTSDTRITDDTISEPMAPAEGLSSLHDHNEVRAAESISQALKTLGHLKVVMSFQAHQELRHSKTQLQEDDDFFLVYSISGMSRPYRLQVGPQQTLYGTTMTSTEIPMTNIATGAKVIPDPIRRMPPLADERVFMPLDDLTVDTVVRGLSGDKGSRHFKVLHERVLQGK